MQNTHEPLLPRQTCLPAWFASEAGISLRADQQKALASLVPDKFYRVGLQYGLCEHSFLEGRNVEQALYFDSGVQPQLKRDGMVLALPDALPLPEASVDLAIMPHILDYCADPHSVLREITQVLSPEGVVLISGFHPYSLWGLERKLTPHEAPFDARFISRSVVQGWFELLGFQPLTGSMLNYQLPKLTPQWQRRLGWMDKAGDRWWPTLGAVYLMAFQKKIYGGLGIRKAQRQKSWFPEIKPSPARVTHSGSLKNSSD